MNSKIRVSMHNKQISIFVLSALWNLASHENVHEVSNVFHSRIHKGTRIKKLNKNGFEINEDSSPYKNAYSKSMPLEALEIIIALA